MTPWMFTEISQLIVTVLVLAGGMALIMTNAILKLGIDAGTIGFVQGLMTAWSGFWLGAKVQRNLSPSTTTTVLNPDGPVQTKTSMVTPGQ